MKMRLLVVSVLLVFGFPLIMNEVVDSFDKCSDFFLDKKPPVLSGNQNNNNYKLICQRYKNVYRFATLYDTDKKIPVFSAYRYTGHHKGRPNIPWMIEPMLEDLGVEMRDPCVNQAHTGDYFNKDKLDRGHLFPSSHAVDEESAKSTFTLTNIVPQHHSFNSGSWKDMEQKVRGIMDSQCRDKGQTLAFVLTGAVASPENLLNDKVNIPTHMWTVFCCYNSVDKKWESQAHWAENIAERRSVDITANTLEKLEEFLKNKHAPVSTLFNGGCKETLNAAGAQPVASEPDEGAETDSWWDYITSVPQKFYRWMCG